MEYKDCDNYSLELNDNIYRIELEKDDLIYIHRVDKFELKQRYYNVEIKDIVEILYKQLIKELKELKED